MNTSLNNSRPAQHDVGADTMRIPFVPKNRRRHSAEAWMFFGVCLLLADGAALAHFADSFLEAGILAALTMPTGILVILAALEARK